MPTAVESPVEPCWVYITVTTQFHSQTPSCNYDQRIQIAASGSLLSSSPRQSSSNCSLTLASSSCYSLPHHPSILCAAEISSFKICLTFLILHPPPASTPCFFLLRVKLLLSVAYSLLLVQLLLFFLESFLVCTSITSSK